MDRKRNDEWTADQNEARVRGAFCEHLITVPRLRVSADGIVAEGVVCPDCKGRENTLSDEFNRAKDAHAIALLDKGKGRTVSEGEIAALAAWLGDLAEAVCKVRPVQPEFRLVGWAEFLESERA